MPTTSATKQFEEEVIGTYRIDLEGAEPELADAFGSVTLMNVDKVYKVYRGSEGEAF